MSAPYSADDVRNILEVFATEFAVDIPATFIDGDMYLGENELITSVFVQPEEWFSQIAEFANEVVLGAR